MQSSFESRVLSDTFNGEEEQVVAYSNKRKQLKNTSKSVAKKASPKNAFFNNSTLGEMSNVWQKYRRNMHEAKQKSGSGEQSQTTTGVNHSASGRNGGGKAHSLSR